VDSFDELFQREYPHVAGYCWRLVDDSDLAADIAQEAFARLLARWLRVREPRAYVYRIATNLVREAWRERLRPLPEDTTAPSDPTTADIAVRLAVDALPLRYRTVVWLHYFAGLPVAEVAAVVGRRSGTVKWQLSEARARLARVLEDGHA